MTTDEGMAQFDRFIAAGYPAPDPDRFAAAYSEFAGAVGSYPTLVVEKAVTGLIRGRTGHFWPTVGELREWAQSREGGPISRPEFAARVAALAKRRTMPAAQRTGEEG